MAEVHVTMLDTQLGILYSNAICASFRALSNNDCTECTFYLARAMGPQFSLGFCWYLTRRLPFLSFPRTSSNTNCDHCGSKTHVAGPMWGGPLHNAAFIERMLKDVSQADKEVYATTDRIEGMLDTALDEIYVSKYVPEKGAAHEDLIPRTIPEQVDESPFFVIPSALSKVIHAQAPSEAAFKGALRHAGYRATRSHCKPGSIKTEAPWAAIWEIMREWVRQKSPIKEGKVKENMPGWKILQAAREPEKDAEESAESPEIVTEHTVDEPAAAATKKAGDGAAGLGQQVRGKKKLAKNASSAVPVRLLKNVKTFGKKGKAFCIQYCLHGH